MINMSRGQFYFTIWCIITWTGAFAEMEAQAHSMMSIIVALVLYLHNRHVEKQEAEQRKRDHEDRHRNSKLSIILATFLITACTATNIQQYTALDATDKTITVPAGASGLKGEIKKMLSDNGWELVVYTGPDVIESKNNRLEQFGTFKTRYQLALTTSRYDYCFNFEPAISYDITLIDNKTGSEVITMEGRGCEKDVAKAFLEALTK